MHCNTYNWLNWHLQCCSYRFPRSHGQIINVNRGRDSILIERIEQNIVILSNGVRGVDKIYDVTVISRKTDDIC